MSIWPDTPPKFPIRWRLVERVIATILIAASVAVVARSARRTFRSEPSIEPRAVEPYTNSAERTARHRDMLGKFATGDRPGDRVMTIDAAGRIRIHPIGPLGKALAVSDTYAIGHLDDHPCLRTSHIGLVESIDIDHLLFWGDRYTRQQGGPGP